MQANVSTRNPPAYAGNAFGRSGAVFSVATIAETGRLYLIRQTSSEVSSPRASGHVMLMAFFRLA